MSWILDNKEWLFSGLGLTVLGVFYYLFSNKPKKSGNTATNINNIAINLGESPREVVEKTINRKRKTLDDFKNETRILFVDDDARFKVAKILVKSGWVHTKLIKDCTTLEESDILDAQILFIDVQGVGVAMGFSDEGLGLAIAIKKKYPTKKVVIYSAETQGNRFHEALRMADSFLPKNADPYEFQRLVEEFTIGHGS